MSAVTNTTLTREELFKLYRADAESLVDAIYSPGGCWENASKKDPKAKPGTLQKILIHCDINQFWFLSPINEFLESRKLPKVLVRCAYERTNPYKCHIILRVTEQILREHICPFSNALYYMHRPGIVFQAEKIFRRYNKKSK